MQKLSDSYSSIKPHYKTEGDISVSNIKMRTISYKTLLDDNDKDHYQIDWNKIVTDPKTLLAFVNLNMSVKEAREKALKNQSVDLKLVNDSANSKPPAEHDPSTEIACRLPNFRILMIE